MNFLGFELFTKGLESIEFRQKLIINTLNPHSYAVSKSDIIFKNALQECEYLVPDGIGICIGAKFTLGASIAKVAGDDVHKYLLGVAEMQGARVFYLGSTDNALQLIKERISIEYPAVLVETFSPPYLRSFSEDLNAEIVNRINQFSPDFIFVGLGAPKQEKWIYENRDALNFGAAACIGAVFDFYSGVQSRPSKTWQFLGLEWLVRLLKDPCRLWRRTFISLPIFILDMLIFKFLQ